MFKEVLLFELFYRKNRAASYAYFGITFLIGFLGVASSVIKLGGAVGLITANAPYVICRMTLISSLLLSIITSAIMGVAVVRDFDHQMDGILFSMPVKKGDYLMGRFFGSFLTLIFINLALPLGFITGFAIGKYVPWDVAWKSQWVIPFDAWNYLQPFLLLLIPNLFATSALFFMSGALGRKPIVIYMQGILLVVLYQIANSYLRDLDSQYLAAIIDPYGIQTFLYTTRYWTPAEQNTLLLPFEGPMLYNRLLWTGIGFVALLITYRFFSFNVIRGLKNDIPAADAPPLRVSALPKVRRVLNASTYLSQTWQSSLLYFRMIAKEIPFIAIAGSGLVLFLLNASKINSIYGTGSYPTTASMLDLINNSFSLFFLIIVVFYSGELIWKERSMNFSMITDSLPVPRAVGLASKFVGLLLIFALLILLLITCGIAAQTAYGYFKFDLPLYFAGLFGSTFVNLLLLTLVSFFIQALVNDKFTGFVLCIIFYIANALLNQFGIEHELWQFGSGKLGLFSEINQYGHFITPFVWLKIHWMALSLILFVVAILFSAHGAETSMKLRWQTGKLRFTRPLLLFSAAMACIFLFSGFFIYYNTNIINRFMGSGAYKERQANYEKQLAKYRNFPQPKIVATNINVDLFPAGRDFIAEGYYYLKNKSHQPIQQIHVQGSLDDQLKLDRLIFDRDAKIREGHKEFYYTIYELSRALQPGDSLKVNFKLSFSTKGFVEGPSNTDIVFNGTFFNNTYFPGIGYDAHLELTDPDDRKKYALPKKDLLAKPGDLKERDVSTHGDDADHIRLEMIVGTSGDQTAIAPGFLQRVWKKNGRNYFHFKTPEPIRNFYSVFSGRYRVRKDQWKDVNLEIYYHPGHEFNLNGMMKGMKDALNYCSDNFSPFQFKQLRIVEFPRYKTTARSFANTIPFSEGIGFMLRVGNPDKNLDMAYYVTAREVAHQWWGQQVHEANVQGGALLSDGLSQFSALMVIRHSLSPNLVERCLKYELDNYLRGRTQEKKIERPLITVENQPYVYSNKSSLIFFALQDYIGEDNLNTALRAYNKMWAFKDAPYPTSLDLLEQIRRVTPDSLHYLLHDMFETVTIFENKALNAEYKEGKKGKFELTLSASCQKIRIDSAGLENNVPIDDWIDIGVYSTDANGEDKLIYLKKHKVTKENNRFVISVNSKPTRAGIDPLHKLIDRHADDNTIAAGEFIEIINLPLDY